MKRTARTAGFGLVEVLVAVAITLVASGFLVRVLRSSADLSSTTLALGKLEEAGHQVTLAVTEELRWADRDSLLVTSENDSDRIDFRSALDYDGTTITWSPIITYRFEYSPHDANRNGIVDEGRLVRLEDGRRRVVCRNVARGGLRFRIDEDNVSVELDVFAPTGADGRVVDTTIDTSVTLVNRGT